MLASASASCPCGSGGEYSACCQPLHQGQAALTPEALMRSRYAAFVLELQDYLIATWHTSTCPPALDLAGNPQWTGLQVLSHQQRGDRGQVHFRALHKAPEGWGFLEEVSSFVREGGRWFYVAGGTQQGSYKPSRNEICPCGSGRKYKTCCL